MPAATLAWLAEQAGRNADRIRRMHAELAAILGAADVASVEVMPLKGAVLTTMPGADPSRRPMADLDLLVRPGDRGRLAEVLVALGYRHAPDGAPATDARRLRRSRRRPPGGPRRRASGQPAPGRDPRRGQAPPVGLGDDDDLTAALWPGRGRGEILGEPATLPRPRERCSPTSRSTPRATC